MLGSLFLLSKNKEVSLYPRFNEKKSHGIDINNGESKKNENQISRLLKSTDDFEKSRNDEIKREQNEGEKVAYEEAVKEHEKQEEMLADMLSHSNQVLFHAKAVFPFDFFPNELIVDLSKATFVEREFFGTGSTNSVYIKDIANVGIETGPFLSTFRIVDVSYNTDKHVIHFLRKKDAQKAQEIVQGLVTASKENFDLTKLKPEEVVPFICKISGMQRISSL